MTIEAGSSAEAAIQAQEKRTNATPESARKFIEAAEAKLFDLWIRASRAQWVHQTFITHDTEILSAQADQVVKATTADLAAQSNQYEHLKLPEDVARKIYLLKHSVDIPAPRDPAEQAELSQIVASLESDYGQGKWCPDGAQGKCLTLNESENIMASSRDPNELDALEGLAFEVGFPCARPTRAWSCSPIRARANSASPNVGAMWRSGYDMPPDAFAPTSIAFGSTCGRSTFALHATCARSSRRKYGSGRGARTRPSRPISSAICGRRSGPIFIRRRAARCDPGYDLGEMLKAKNMDAVEWCTTASASLRRLDFAAAANILGALDVHQPARPRGRLPRQRLGCDCVDDLRIKMCIEPTAEDFSTIHHELATISTSVRTTNSRPSSAVAPTTVSTKPSATRSRFPSRPNT